VGTAGAAVLSAQDAQHVHEVVAQERLSAPGRYQPKALTAHEYATLQRLSDWIIPADEHSPGALAANAADFLDFLCSASDEMKAIYTGGLAWLDEAMIHRYGGKDFLAASSGNQAAMLDLIAFRANLEKDASLGPGIRFFAWVRKMVADAYYTHPIGVKDLGYMGNTAMTRFSVPQAAVDFALKRSPFGG
jgi:hypothetical protein